MSRCTRYRSDLLGASLVLACFVCACEPELVVGERVVAETTCESPNFGAAGAGPEDKVVEIGWETGFENGFCDYADALGFCYADSDASFEIVSDPVRSGDSAAAFSLTTQPDSSQTRCFLEGVLPLDAVYGAWFYIPEFAANAGNWNLMYIQGMGQPAPGLWDVSLSSTDDGSLHLYMYSHSGQPVPPWEPAGLNVPIATWFHVEFRLLRAKDATGTVELYQDGALVQEATGIITDEYDIHQWYVGNLATALTPAESTVYVDDVTISEMIANSP